MNGERWQRKVETASSGIPLSKHASHWILEQSNTSTRRPFRLKPKAGIRLGYLIRRAVAAILKAVVVTVRIYRGVIIERPSQINPYSPKQAAFSQVSPRQISTL